MIGKTIDELKVGDTAETKTVSEADIYMYAGVTGDANPAHIDEVYASNTFFKTRIAHGMLLGGFISTVLGNRLPGNGTIYMKQELEFLAPVHIGDTVTARAEVVEIIQDKNRVLMRTTCVNQDGVTVVDGEALVSPPKAPKRSG
jgi:3-hydroxybutyryl-CoA dehydratase